MSFLALQFYSIAAKFGFSQGLDPKCTLEQIVDVIKTCLPGAWDRLLQKSPLPDMSDPQTFLDLLHIDTVILIRSEEETVYRAAVSIYDRRYKAEKTLYRIRGKYYTQAREQLKIDRHWVFVFNGKGFPSQFHWSEALCQGIELLKDQKDCVLLEVPIMD